MARPARVSPDRILAAAAVEFSARGYAGARVDRIARRARVNKAMLYYHYLSKQALYRALLRRTFSQAATRLAAIASAEGAPADKLDRSVAAIAAFIRQHAHFPAIMLREIAEGGAHLDPETLAALAALPRSVASIVRAGVRSGDFRPVHPLAVYFSVLAPLVMYLTGAPIRKQLSAHHLIDDPLAPDAFITHVQDTLRRALAHESSRP
jgi:TetR/AcrR family transcriptional regulator